MAKNYEIVANRSKYTDFSMRRRQRYIRNQIVQVLAVLVSIAALVAFVLAIFTNPVSGKLSEDFSDDGIEVLPQTSVPLPCPSEVPLSEGPTILEPEEQESSYVLYDVPLSEELQHYTQDLCKQYNVSFPLVLAIMMRESNFRPDVVSGTDDYGIMQINSCNHEWLEEELGITDWFDPEQNILAGVYILSGIGPYEDVHKTLMSYNCGPSGARKLWADGVKSTAYSRAVVEILEGLEVIENG